MTIGKISHTYKGTENIPIIIMAVHLG